MQLSPQSHYRSVSNTSVLIPPTQTNFSSSTSVSSKAVLLSDVVNIKVLIPIGLSLQSHSTVSVLFSEYSLNQPNLMLLQHGCSRPLSQNSLLPTNLTHYQNSKKSFRHLDLQRTLTGVHPSST